MLEQDREARRGNWLLAVLIALLVLLIAVYLGLHGILRLPVLIRTVEFAPTAAPAINSVNATLTAITDTVPAQTRKDLAETQLPALRRVLASDPDVEATIYISATLAALESELTQPNPNTTVLRTLLDHLALQTQPRYFWTQGLGAWIEFFFWALAGTLLFLINEVKRHRPDETLAYRKYTPWYVANLFLGPFIALFILFFLKSLKMEIAGVNVSLDSGPFGLSLFFAAILGYYSRVAAKQLDLFVAKILPDAWSKAQPPQPPSLTIQPSSVQLGPGESYKFEAVPLLPDEKIIWDLSPQDAGSLNGGQYTAPKSDKVTGTQVVTIKVVSQRDKTRSAQAIVTLFTAAPQPEAPPPTTTPQATTLPDAPAPSEEPTATASGNSGTGTG